MKVHKRRGPRELERRRKGALERLDRSIESMAKAILTSAMSEDKERFETAQRHLARMRKERDHLAAKLKVA